MSTLIALALNTALSIGDTPRSEAGAAQYSNTQKTVTLILDDPGSCKRPSPTQIAALNCDISPRDPTSEEHDLRETQEGISLRRSDMNAFVNNLVPGAYFEEIVFMDSSGIKVKKTVLRIPYILGESYIQGRGKNGITLTYTLHF